MASKRSEAHGDGIPKPAVRRFPPAVAEAGDRLEPTSVGIRELARNVSGVVAAVANSGRPTVVTKHGQPIAIVVSLRPGHLGERIVAEEIDHRVEAFGPLAAAAAGPGVLEAAC